MIPRVRETTLQKMVIAVGSVHMSRGLRPTPPPRLDSIVVLAQVCVCVSTCFVAEGVVICCSCIMFLGPLPGTICFSMLFVFVANKLQRLSPNLVEIIKMLLEVAPERHGEPLVPKLRPG